MGNGDGLSGAICLKRNHRWHGWFNPLWPLGVITTARIAVPTGNRLWLCDHPASRIVQHDDLGHFPELENVTLIHGEIVRFVGENA